MSQGSYLFLTFFVLATTSSGDGAKILGIFPVPSKSHMIFTSALTKELARRGHEMTVISKFPLESPVANYTDIALQTKPHRALANTFSLQREEMSFMKILPLLWDLGLRACEEALSQPEIQDLIRRTDLHFDAVIFLSLASDCYYGFVHKFKAPFIQIVPNNVDVCMGDTVGNPYTTSYLPNLFLGYSDKMTFSERFLNTFAGLWCAAYRRFYVLPKHEALMRQYFQDPSLPSIVEMEKNASLLLINSHFSTSYPRPLTPNSQEVGGMHVKPSKKLPEDLQKFLDEATDGAIFFSLGSNIRSADLPPAQRQVFLDVFSTLKQRILWKWETDSLPGQPANMRLGKWLPQNDILGHPNVRLFITHGGLLSTQEATYHGVPLLAIPVMGDQRRNAETAERSGYAIVLNIFNLTTESLTWALNELLTNPRYRDNVKEISTVFRDQPQSPLEKAVYWTEYVLRHKGAPHMRSAALDLWWFQYYLLDVLVVLLGAVAASLAATWVSCCALYRLLFPSRLEPTRAKKMN